MRSARQALATLRPRATATCPTRSSSAAPRRWRAPSTPSRRCARCSGVLEQQYVVVTLLRDVLDRGLQVAIGTETGMAPLAECALDRRPVPGRGRARRHDRRPRPEPHGLPAGDGGRRRRQPPALAAPERRLTLAADFYDLLEVSRDATRRRHQARLPTPGPAAAPRHQPGSRRRGALQGDHRRLRGALRPREAAALRPLRRRGPRRRSVRLRRRRRHQRHLRRLLRRRQPLRRWRPPRTGRARRGARTSRWSPTSSFEEAVFGARHSVDGAHRGRLRDLRGHRRQAGHRSRSPASSAPAPARCSGCARASSARWSRTPSARAAAARAR